MTTAIYVRISDDRRDGVGVENQLRTCRDWCIAEGWAPAAEYIDNDVSASVYARKPRKAFQAMLKAVEAGNVGRIVCFATDRLYRQPRELEVLIPLAERVEVRSKVGGVIDLATAGGRLNARIQGALAANESDLRSERIRQAQQGARDRGDPHGGPRPFGWLALDGKPSWDPRRHDPTEAALIRQAVDDVLAGATISDVARAWTRAGVAQPHGALGWHPTTIRTLLTSARNAGLVTYRGDVLREGTWAPIIDRARWERVCAELEQRSSRFSTARRRRKLLSGVLVCGHCGKLLMHGGSGSRDRKDGSRRPGVRIYLCKAGPGASGCGRVQIGATPLERDVTEALLAYLDTADLASLAGATDDSEATTVTGELTELERDARETADLAAAGEIRPADFARYSSGIDGRRRALRQRLARMSSSAALAPYAGHQGALRAAWPALSDDQRRMLFIAAFGRLTVSARTKGAYGYDFSRIRADRGAAVAAA
jgi:DNA invertase Pin-like site-specific DNA recombinase